MRFRPHKCSWKVLAHYWWLIQTRKLLLFVYLFLLLFTAYSQPLHKYVNLILLLYIYTFSPDDGESDDRLPEQPMTTINNKLSKIKRSTSKMSIINDFGKAMMYNCEPCGKLLNGAKAKNQHDRLVHSKVLYLIVLCMIFTIPLTFLGQFCNAYLYSKFQMCI